ncbi:hypothetical protein KZJ38_07070 [Paraburkholderia edwinii]|uniref:PH (Pleckstrin Homology) domain-containing protein n=1 Tax=Paraburkholderia edwinii TaxID=2861782 RepID=A0ABX8UN92_9BURK|nr:hypothetical protein [Paraburkholderia edwinii]QYD70066.1 hypothetical protein KZJ38_07070 [Paraburkholderia edwinii]
MARTKQTRANAAPGAGTIFALRAIGLVILARWLFSMSDMDVLTALSAMASSPWACINLVFLFLLIFLPGARARAERPFHPLPQWLRQALRLFAFLGFLFAVWSVGAFAWTAGWRRAAHAVAATNGWLLAAPALYAAVLWICRPRALWRTNIGARRFAIGRFAISIDNVTRTTIVWMESRKVGQYDARELSVRWPAAGAAGDGGRAYAGSAAAGAAAPDASAAHPVSGESAASDGQMARADAAAVAVPRTHGLDDVASGHAASGAAEPHVVASDAGPLAGGRAPAAASDESSAQDLEHASTSVGAEGRPTDVTATAPRATASASTRAGAHSMPPRRAGLAGWLRRPKIELMWDSPAAAGHNRQTVFRVPLVSESDRAAARALDASLRQTG